MRTGGQWGALLSAIDDTGINTGIDKGVDTVVDTVIDTGMDRGMDKWFPDEDRYILGILVIVLLESVAFAAMAAIMMRFIAVAVPFLCLLSGLCLSDHIVR